MDPCLHLALLETVYDGGVVEEVRALPFDERGARQADLLATEVPADVDEARWTDETELFWARPDDADDTIRSLAGIDAYPGLRLLYLKEAQVDDLRPLALLPALELAWVGVSKDADLGPLLACERLRRVNLDAYIPPTAAAREVLTALAARGVQVDDLLPDAEEAAAPFADPILKLAVLDELQHVIDLPELVSFDEYAFDDGNLERLMAIELSAAHLDRVERLAWMGGGHTTAHLVWSQWDGESDEFDITSLQGIEALRNLRRLEVSPLGKLPEDQVNALRERGVTVTEY